MPTQTDGPVVCGIDEAGRGALAGPLVAAGVILTSQSLRILGRQPIIFRDGKELTRFRRAQVVKFLEVLKVRYVTHVVSARTINTHGIQSANRTAFREIINRMQAETYFVDGRIRLGRFPRTQSRIHTVVGGDAFILPVILAGIIAKHTRDGIMDSLSQKYPWYSWEKNAGYGTREHIHAIRMSGMSPEHRTLFVHTALSHPGST